MTFLFQGEINGTDQMELILMNLLENICMSCK